MKLKGETSHPKTYGSMMSAYASKGMWADALDLLDSMLESGAVPNPITLNLAIESCIEGKEYRRALDVYYEAKANQQPVDEVTHRLVMEACRRGRMAPQATMLLESMAQESFGVTTSAFNVYINLVGSTREWEEAVALFEEMDERGLQRDIFSYNAVIASCMKAGAWEKSLEMLDLIKANAGVEPNGFTYSATISACAQDAPTQALMLFQDMKAVGLSPTEFSYCAALNACKASKDPASTRFILSEAMDWLKSSSSSSSSSPSSSSSLSLGIPVYTCAIEALLALGDTDEAMALYLEANDIIQESGRDVEGAVNFRAATVELRQRHWKDTWREIQSSPAMVEPEGIFTERWSRPTELDAPDQVVHNNIRDVLRASPEHAEEEARQVMKEIDEDEVIRRLQEQGVVDVVRAMQQGEEQEQEQQMDEGVIVVAEEDIGEEWEEVDPLEIPEIRKALNDDHDNDDE
mmetsp:Transcript_10933/g.21710  ORF Transcript_10933/g.21710 Transcript_10933/m.21710 type:complete len:463 (+) Transcript_10933:1-1389(+)